MRITGSKIFSKTFLSPSSRGLGHCPFTAITRVRIPLGTPFYLPIMMTRQQLANAIRALSMDAVQKANSGHPGAPMGLADVAQVLWQDFLRHHPANPSWVNRDRFVLSNGHASMLLYALLHLSGYALSIEDIKQFRQLHSKTPGHPEYGITPGVETTTGPLAQGFANAVGMALGERTLASEFNRPEFPIVDHYTYVIVGDGCLMEGLSHEVASLAGTLGLGKLIVFWDNNGISIDGEVKDWFSENVVERFHAYHWHVVSDIDGHDPDKIANAIKAAKNEKNKPSLICCKTQIAFGAPNKANTAEAHGSPLGEEEIVLVREKLNWHHAPFFIPPEIYAAWDSKEKGKKLEEAWQALFKKYQQMYPALAFEFLRRKERRLPENYLEKINELKKTMQAKSEKMATRKSSQIILNTLGPILPELLGGSADLTPSNLTAWSGSRVINAENQKGNYLHYGVREFGMCAIMNGLALYGGFIPYGGTFLTFVDYARNAVRMAAIMEQLGPSCLLLSRQKCPSQHRSDAQVEMISRGAYVLWEADENPEYIFIATGSEVSLALEAAKRLQTQHKSVRVVSMPCAEIFCQQPLEYQETVLPSSKTKRIAIEAGATAYWYKFVGMQGKVLGLDRYGESAPSDVVYQALGFTVEKLLEMIRGEE